MGRDESSTALRYLQTIDVDAIELWSSVFSFIRTGFEAKSMRNKARLMPRRKSSESGFALPIAIGTGLIMLLIGITIIVRSQTDKNDAVIRKDSSDSLTAAETGVSRVREFLNRYRMLALYPACSGGWNTSAPNLGDCDDTSITNWDNPAAVVSLEESCSTSDSNATAVSDVQALTTGDWRPVDASDASQGEYRLISYTYDRPAGQQDPSATGTLTMQGRIQKNGSTVSEAQLLVDFPVEQLQTQAASLWVDTSVSGNPGVDSDVLAPCNVGQSVAQTGNLIRTDLTMPSLPPSFLDAGYYDPPQTFTGSALTLTPNLTLPQVGDTPVVENGKYVYKYFVSQINESLTIKPPTIDPDPLDSISSDSIKVQILVSSDGSSIDGDLTLDGDFIRIEDDTTVEIVSNNIDIRNDGEIQVLGENESSTVQLWANRNIEIQNGAVRNFCNTDLDCGPFDFKIYGTGVNGTSLTLNEEATICDTLFHAPSYNLTFNSGTASTTKTCGTGTNTGIYWVNQWSGSSSDGTAIDAPRARWSEMPTQPSPQLGPVGQWLQQDVP